MLRFLPILLLTAVGCSASPDASNGVPTGDAALPDLGPDLGPTDDVDAEQSTGDVADDADVAPQPDVTGGDASEEEFEFGFEPNPFDFVLTGSHFGTATWQGEDVTPSVFLVVTAGDVVGTLGFDHQGEQITYRLGGVVVPAGELRLTATTRTCLSGGSECGPDLPPALVDVPVWDVVARYDGTDVVFAPFDLRATAVDAAPDHDFEAPADVVMVPNDGFKPAMVPDPVGDWEGIVTFLASDRALSGTGRCTVSITEMGADPVVSAMSCGGSALQVDADPGPDAGSVTYDDLEMVMQFDFVDSGTRYRFAGYVSETEYVGIILEADAADQLDSPFDAEQTALRGTFLFGKTF